MVIFLMFYLLWRWAFATPTFILSNTVDVWTQILFWFCNPLSSLLFLCTNCSKFGLSELLQDGSSLPLLKKYILVGLWALTCFLAQLNILAHLVLQYSSQQLLQGTLVLFCGKWFFRNCGLGARCAYCYWDVITSGPFSGKGEEILFFLFVKSGAQTQQSQGSSASPTSYFYLRLQQKHWFSTILTNLFLLSIPW